MGVRETHRAHLVFNEWMLAFVIAIAAFSCVAGCGRPSGSVIVEGKVRYDGKAVTNGDIRFFPEQGSSGRPSGAPIVDGVYKAHYQGGVPKGTHRVEIRAFALEGVGPVNGAVSGPVDITTKASDVKGLGKSPRPVFVVEGRKQFLPPKYNDQSELKVSITGDEPRETHDFELKSKAN